MTRNTTKPEHHNVQQNADALLWCMIVALPLTAGFLVGATIGMWTGDNMGRREVLRQAAGLGYAEPVLTTDGERAYRRKR